MLVGLGAAVVLVSLPTAAEFVRVLSWQRGSASDCTDNDLRNRVRSEVDQLLGASQPYELVSCQLRTPSLGMGEDLSAEIRPRPGFDLRRIKSGRIRTVRNRPGILFVDLSW